MKKITIFYAFALAMGLVSCTTNKFLLNYDIGCLVESTSSAQDQYYTDGITEIIDFRERTQKGSNYKNYHYEDEHVSMDWQISTAAFYFTLQNKTNQTIKINWEDIAYSNSNGTVSRMIHKEIPLGNARMPQVPISIPRNSQWKDYLIPVESIYLEDEEDKTYNVKRLFFAEVSTKRDREFEKAQEQIGQTVSIQIPVIINGTQHNYVFTFNIKDVQKGEIVKYFSRGRTTWLAIGSGIAAFATVCAAAALSYWF